MCIGKSVGKNGFNRTDDVKTVQILLNLNNPHVESNLLLPENGAMTPNMIKVIEDFQREVMEIDNPDGRVDAGGRTLERLRQGMPPLFNKSKLKGIFIHASDLLIDRYYNALHTKMADNAINTPLRMAHFLAQIGHESGELRYSEEIASGEAYEGRADLGNTEPGDGRRFKGRGLIQLTGRANYQEYGDSRGVDYTSEGQPPLLSTDPNVAVDVAGWFWDERGLNRLADKDDVKAITRVINGGYNGLDDRREKLARAKFFLIK